MTLHLIKLCVGCDSVKDLEDWIREKQRERRKQGQPREHIHRTRMAPKRADELTDGGSLFWVIRGQVMCRQKLTGVRPYVDKAGIGRCELVLAPKVVPVEPRPYRAFQGWRYLDVEGRAARPRPRRAGRPQHARDAAPRTARTRPALISPKRVERHPERAGRRRGVLGIRQFKQQGGAAPPRERNSGCDAFHWPMRSAR